MCGWGRVPWTLLLMLALGACDDAGGGRDDDPAPPDAAPDAAGTAPDMAAPDMAVPDAAAPTPDAAPDPDAAPPDAGPALDAATPPPEVHGVETRLGTPSTVAGLADRVTCEALDADGVPIAGVATRFEVRPAAGWRAAEGDPASIVGVLAGTYEVVCVADGLGLRDATPARWDVLAGPAAAVHARVEPSLVAAGGTASVDCAAEDAEGNPVDAAAATVVVTPAGAGVAVEGRDVRPTAAGRYRVDCALPGALSESAAALTVVPGPPAALVAAVVPERPVHDVGAVVALRPTVTDAFGNAIAGAPLEWSTRPALPAFGEGRFRPAAEGRYTLTVRVGGPTFEDRALEASADILVDAGGPAVGCTSPAPGAMLAGMGPVRLEGQVSDVAGVDEVRVDGQPVPVGPDGHFAVDVQPAWGLNVHDVVAVDAFGNENSTFCSYFAAERYHPEDAPLDDAVLFHLTGAAVDDGAPDRPLRSLTDLLRSVVNSPGLVQTLDESLRAQNPIVPNECRQRILGACVLRLGAEYRGMRIHGPNEMNISLVNGGLRLRARINRLDLDVDLQGTISTDGTISADYILADLTFGVSLENGRPRVRRIATNAVEVGSLDSDFDGISGALLDLVFWAFESVIRDQVTDTLRGFLEGQVDALLGDVLAGLDVSAFGTEIEIPSLGGGDPIRLGVDVGLSTMDANPDRLLLGMGTTVRGPINEGAPSAGIPEVTGPRRIGLRPQGTVGGAVSITLMNQILHRLWRAGLFRLDDAGGLIGEGGGAQFALRFQAPPAVEGAEGGVRLYLGPGVGTIALPELFDEPLQVRMAVQAHVAVGLVGGGSIRFGDGNGGGIEIERLHLAFDGASVSQEARATLEARLVRVIQALIDGALNGALPELPIPDFELPESLAPYGIAPGTRLGLRDPRFFQLRSHWILDGEFRE
jgi:hypothetical protein